MGTRTRLQDVAPPFESGARHLLGVVHKGIIAEPFSVVMIIGTHEASLLNALGPQRAPRHYGLEARRAPYMCLTLGASASDPI